MAEELVTLHLTSYTLAPSQNYIQWELTEDALKNQTVVWVTPEENNQLPFACYLTVTTR
jgi:hypothetical protein